MIPLDAGSFLLQWAAGGLLFCWVTTRRRQVSLGYGWLLRGTYGLLALAGAVVGFAVIDPLPVRDLANLGVALAAAGTLAVSATRRAREAGVAEERATEARKAARVAAMTGDDAGSNGSGTGDGDGTPSSTVAGVDAAPAPGEYDPRLDLVAPVIGLVGLVGTAVAVGDPVWLAAGRLLVGAAFLGAVSDAMLLGHWYLVQPGMPRAPLLELVRWVGWLWVPEVALLLVPPGMIDALDGTIDDGYDGLLGWFWVACAVTTIGLVVVTRLALRERAYSAVMAATGLLYLAILTAFGTDVVARALLGLA